MSCYKTARRDPVFAQWIGSSKFKVATQGAFLKAKKLSIKKDAAINNYVVKLNCELWTGLSIET